MQSNLYETDFYAWTLEQSKLLHVGDFKGLDIVNLVEEIESLGKQQRQEFYQKTASTQSSNFSTLIFPVG